MSKIEVRCSCGYKEDGLDYTEAASRARVHLELNPNIEDHLVKYGPRLGKLYVVRRDDTARRAMLERIEDALKRLHEGRESGITREDQECIEGLMLALADRERNWIAAANTSGL